MTLYNLRSPGTITKWDNDGNIEAQYEVSYEGCTCPAGHRHTCRHRQMLPLLEPLADTHWFLDWDNGRTVVDFMGLPKSNYDVVYFDKDIQAALTADGEKLRLLTGEDHGPVFLPEPEGPMKQDTTAPAPRALPWRRI